MAQAARDSGMTRANVSHQLKMLETALGVELIHRTTRKHALTPAGQILFQHVLKMQQESREAFTAIDELGKQIRGEVRVRMPTGLGHLYLAPLLLDFAREHPEIRLRVNINDHIADLVSGDVDIALKIATNLKTTEIVSEIGHIQWCLCASAAYFQTIRRVETPEQLTQKAWITPAAFGKEVTLHFGRYDQSIPIKFVPRLQSGDYPFLVQSVQASMGIAVLPRYAIWEKLQSGELVEVLPHYQISGADAGNSLYLMASRGRYPSLAAQALSDFIIRHLQAHMKDWSA